MTSSHPDDMILVTRDAQAPEVFILTMNYPSRRNAFASQMRQAMLSRLQELTADTRCRAMVLTGAQEAFCAGGDISEMRERTVSDLRERNIIPLEIFRLLAAGPKPVVAAVEGPAMGAGLALAAACDLVVAAENARFCAAFVKVGLLPDTGLFWSLKQRVSGGRARELMLSGREFSSTEAQAYGFVNRVVPQGQALSVACELARSYLAIPPLALAHLRAALASGCGSLEEAIETEVHVQPLLRRSQDHQEAVAAFVSKRKPVFVGN